MSVWKELYDIIDKTRNRWIQTGASKNTLDFEIKTNLGFMMEALDVGVDKEAIIKGFETKAFEQAMGSGFEFNKIRSGLLTAGMIGKHKEFSKYLGKDSAFLIQHLYMKITSLQKVAKAAECNSHPLPASMDLKFKALFRFLVLVVAFLDGKKLGQ